jgi:hypothetical protein
MLVEVLDGVGHIASDDGSSSSAVLSFLMLRPLVWCSSRFILQFV